VCFYLRAPCDGDDTAEQVPDHRLQGRGELVRVDRVDQPETVL
jgi:hypothetical protein